MAQQTAVEWLEKQLLLHTKIENSKYVQQEIIDVALWQLNKYLEQAKQMEKQQIVDAWYNGFEETRPYIDHSEDYYNETYGENKD